MRDLNYKVEQRLKNIALLFEIAEIFAATKTIDVKEIKDLVMPEIVRLANLIENFKEEGE